MYTQISLCVQYTSVSTYTAPYGKRIFLQTTISTSVHIYLPTSFL